MSKTEVVLGPEDLKRCRAECSAEEMTVRWRLGNSGPTAFLTLWLLGWSVGCGVIAHRLWTDPRPATLVFALPFWAGELFVAALLVRYWFGQGRLHHSPSGLVMSEDIGPLHLRREMASSELTGVKVGSVVEDSESKRRVPVLLLEGSDYRWNWGKGLPLVELEWIARELEDRRQRLETLTSSDGARVPVELPVRWTEAPATVPTRPPYSEWDAAESGGVLIFTHRPRFDLRAVAVLVFATAFCNSIILLFVGTLWGWWGDQMPPPKAADWWPMFLFLIPFELFGVLLIVAVAAALVRPFARRRWRFDESSVHVVRSWMGLPWGSRYDVLRVAALSIAERRRWWQGQLESTDTEKKVPPRTAVIEFEAASPSVIPAWKGLTPREAVWVADLVLRSRRDWFRRG